MLSLFTKNAGAPKLLRFGTPTFIVEPKKMLEQFVTTPTFIIELRKLLLGVMH